jgi:hypothetical protein
VNDREKFSYSPITERLSSNTFIAALPPRLANGVLAMC